MTVCILSIIFDLPINKRGETIMQNFLHVLVPHKENSFYTLYVSGCYGRKRPVLNGTDFDFISGSLLVLYYTYPAHRRAYIVRFTENGKTELPGLSEPIHKIICVYARQKSIS